MKILKIAVIALSASSCAHAFSLKSSSSSSRVSLSTATTSTETSTALYDNKSTEFDPTELQATIAELKQAESNASPPASPTARDTTAATVDPSTVLIGDRLVAEFTEVYKCLTIASTNLSKNVQDVTPEDIVKICDDIDKEFSILQQQHNQQNEHNENNQQLQLQQGLLFVDTTLQLRKNALELSRYHLLNKLLQKDYDAYVATAAFLSPSRIPRLDLPNIQDVPFNDIMPSMAATDGNIDALVDDCTLDDKQFNDSILDKILLKIFRNIVTKNTNGVTSPTKGIDGLVEQARTYMLQPNQTPEALHKMVYDTLGGLMTPVLPPFYRIFMAGIVPNLGTSLDGKQFGPWFYAPWLTTVVTPTFFGFLVGPSRPNRRKDGQRGGLVVEKCKFLQESGCKGICLHECKLPAQQFFKEELGLDLTVSPNFATQECQWSFGEKPMTPKEDPSFPTGCLSGCESRIAMKDSKVENISLSCN